MIWSCKKWPKSAYACACHNFFVIVISGMGEISITFAREGVIPNQNQSTILCYDTIDFLTWIWADRTYRRSSVIKHDSIFVLVGWAPEVDGEVYTWFLRADSTWRTRQFHGHVFSLCRVFVRMLFENACKYSHSIIFTQILPLSRLDTANLPIPRTPLFSQQECVWILYFLIMYGFLYKLHVAPPSLDVTQLSWRTWYAYHTFREII